MHTTRRRFLMASALWPFSRPLTARAHSAGKTVRIRFLHHSTGGNLIQGAGGIGAMFDRYNAENGTDYRFTEEWSSPDGDNYPFDYYASTFAPSRLVAYAESSDVIVWKHCFPGSAILAEAGEPDVNSSRKTLGNYKLQYRALRSRFDQYPDVTFMVWTLPPLHRWSTTPEEASRANGFAEWVRTGYLTEEGAHPNQRVFDFRALAANGDGMLRYEYELAHDYSDSHPNQSANDTICPLFFEAIIGCISPAFDGVDARPSGFRVDAPRPNPFNPITTIHYEIPRTCHVRVSVFDTLGRTVAVIGDGVKSAGGHDAVWNGCDASGRPAASGVYLYAITAGEYRFRGKFTLVR